MEYLSYFKNHVNIWQQNALVHNNYLILIFNIFLVCAQISPGGGFGPVADDGYGISYMVPDDHKVFFHISSKISSEQTNSERFVRLLFESMAEIKELFEAVKTAKNQNCKP